MKRAWILFILVVGSALSAHAAHRADATHRPKLIVLLVFDQFRADYLTRFESRFLPVKQPDGNPGGFRWLIENGAYFPFAQYDILQSMTGPGHATILTGAFPYQAGIPLNDWYDRDTHSRTYCTEDSTAPTVGASPKDSHVGTSPRNLVATTVGDELKNAGYPSKVISISLKDRAAILMGGHRADIALWLDKDSSHWVSSKFYFVDGKLPVWVQELNAALDREKGHERSWTKGDHGTLFTEEGESVHAPSKFPHRFDEGSKASLASPFGLELTEKAVEGALKQYDLGAGQATDILAISFSSHDYVGHAFGPNSREMEEMTVADDRAVAWVLKELKKRVPGGLENVALVLTGDHGIPSQPDYLKEHRIDAGHVNEHALVERIESRLDQRFGKPKTGSWLGFSVDFNFSIDPRALADRGAKREEVEAEIKAELLKEHWVAQVFTRSEYFERRLPPGMFERQILHTYFDGRSGDVIAIPKPFFMPEGDNVTHLTGYSYDRSVPLILSGRFFRKGVYSEKAETVDIAPTLSFLTGTIAPSLSEGRVLSEALVPGVGGLAQTAR